MVFAKRVAAKKESAEGMEAVAFARNGNVERGASGGRGVGSAPRVAGGAGAPLR